MNNLKGQCKDDWCHTCGKREFTQFATFTVPENAEHSMRDEARGYFRICKTCVQKMYSVVLMARPSLTDESATQGTSI